MATEISIASFKSACSAVADAIIARDWAEAATRYGVAEAINAGLEVEAEADGVKARRRETLVGLKTAIDTARTTVGVSTNRGRIMVMKTGYNR